MAPRHDSFVWDAGKARLNLTKHGVRFEDAARVLADPMGDVFHLEIFDDEHSDNDEDRWITIGSEPQGRDICLLVVWTRRPEERPQAGEGRIPTRIISARVVTRRERRDYEQHLRNRFGR
jgi:uncharacterized DUF497 family protein